MTLLDIYQEIEKRTGLSATKGARIEYELEMELCYPNPYMKRIFQLLLCKRKRIVLVSDMYMSSKELAGILHRCGYDGYEELYVSCEHNSNKYSGTIYENVMNRMGRAYKYIHIGDVRKSDYEMAKAAGMDAFYYQSCNEMGTCFRASQYGMSRLIGSAYGALANQHLHNGLFQSNVYYEYGFLYGGLYVYGFCQWIHRFVTEHKIEKILFLSRDGYIYQRIYETIFPDSPSSYVYSSRIANSLLCAEKQRDMFLRRNIEMIARYDTKMTIGNFIETYDLQFLKDILPRYGLQEYHSIVLSNVPIISEMITCHWNSVIEAFERSSCSYRNYLTDIVRNVKQIAIVDTGWQGSTLLGMKWLIEERWNTGCTAHCLMAAAAPTNPTVNQTHLMSGKLHAYLFTSNENRSNYVFHTRQYGANLLSYLFEIFTQAPHPTFRRMIEEDGKRKMIFGVPEAENYEIIRNIHQGVIDFCRMYSNTFKNVPIMSMVSAHDAYVPFQFIAKNPRFFKQFFMGFSYSKATGGGAEGQNMETLSDLFNAAEKGRK